MWWCGSIRPGKSVRPARSTTTVSLSASAITAAAEPILTILLPLTAMASTVAGPTMGTMVPPLKMVVILPSAAVSASAVPAPSTGRAAPNIVAVDSAMKPRREVDGMAMLAKPVGCSKNASFNSIGLKQPRHMVTPLEGNRLSYC